MNFGKAEGLKKNDLEAVFPYIYQAFNDIKNPERYDIGYPGGETTGAVQQRFMKYINKCLKKGGSACCWLRTECSSAFLPKYA